MREAPTPVRSPRRGGRKRKASTKSAEPKAAKIAVRHSDRRVQREAKKQKTPQEYAKEWATEEKFIDVHAEEFQKHAVDLLTKYTREQRLDNEFMAPIIEPDRKRKGRKAEHGGWLLCAYNVMRRQMEKRLCLI